jgi:hypothetical protein
MLLICVSALVGCGEKQGTWRVGQANVHGMLGASRVREREGQRCRNPKEGIL